MTYEKETRIRNIFLLSQQFKFINELLQVAKKAVNLLHRVSTTFAQNSSRFSSFLFSF